MRRTGAGPLESDDSVGQGRSGVASSPRTIDWAAASHALLPQFVRRRAITVSVSTDHDDYRPGEPVSIDVTLENRLPVPIRLRTDSPAVWFWSVDGFPEASRLPRATPDRPSTIAFARSECKRFRRRWSQRIRVAEREWESIDPGRYVLEAGIARADADACGLVDRTAIEIRE